MANGRRAVRRRIRVPKLPRGTSLTTLARRFGLLHRRRFGTVVGEAIMRPGLTVRKGGFTFRQRKLVTMKPISPKPKLRKGSLR